MGAHSGRRKDFLKHHKRGKQMVKVVWGEPAGSPEAGGGNWGPCWQAPTRERAWAEQRGEVRRAMRHSAREVAAFVVGCILVGLVIGWLLP